MDARDPDPASAGATVFSVDVPVRWSDIDADGRVNNVQVLRYAEEARMQWADVAGFTREAPDLMPVVASVGCTFHAPIGYPATVRVAVRCMRVGRSSVGLQFEISDATQSGTRFATATAAWVWVDRATGVPMPVPASLRALASQQELEK